MGKKKKYKPRKPLKVERFSLAMQGKLLAAVEVSCTLAAACRASGITKDNHFRWMHDDQTYPPRYESSRQKSVQLMEDEARARAVEGERDYVFHNGKPVFVWVNEAGDVVPGRGKGHRKIAAFKLRKSDQLLMFVLKAERREVYGERVEHKMSPTKHEHNHHHEGRIDITDERDRLAALAARCDPGSVASGAVGGSTSGVDRPTDEASGDSA